MKNFKQYILEDTMKVTQEMKDFFYNRTEKHIGLVRKYCKKIKDYYGNRFPGIIKRGEEHDASKYKEPELTPYILITWYYKMKDEGKEYPYTDIMDKASNHHVNINSHHPEFHAEGIELIPKNNRDGIPEEGPIDATEMNDLDIAEMCADWSAMSEEKGTNTPKEWADKVIGKRYRFKEYHVKLIYEILNDIWSN